MKNIKGTQTVHVDVEGIENEEKAEWAASHIANAIDEILAEVEDGSFTVKVNVVETIEN